MFLGLVYVEGAGIGGNLFQSLISTEMRFFSISYLRLPCGLTTWSGEVFPKDWPSASGRGRADFNIVEPVILCQGSPAEDLQPQGLWTLTPRSPWTLVRRGRLRGSMPRSVAIRPDAGVAIILMRGLQTVGSGVCGGFNSPHHG